MSKKPDTTNNENAPINLGRRGGWVGFDEIEHPTQTDPVTALAFLNAAEGVNFVNEFVRQFAEQQGYSDERIRLLENKAHEAVERYMQGHVGVKLRLVSHIDGLAIDDPINREREAFWMLTNGKEFNAFLEAADEPARWHDPSKPAPKPELVTPSKFPQKRTYDVLTAPIDSAIKQAGGVNAIPNEVIAILIKAAHPTDGTTPALPFTELRWKGEQPEWLYQDTSDEVRSIGRAAIEGRIKRRLTVIRQSIKT